METNTENQILQVLGSLPKSPPDEVHLVEQGHRSESPPCAQISPGSVFEDRLPLGRHPQGLFWCPDGIPAGKTTTLLSSRLGRGAFDNKPVGRAIRSFFGSLDNDAILATASGITLDPALQRGCQLFGIRLILFLPFPKAFNLTVANELQSRLHQPNEFRVYYESASGCDQLLLETCDSCRLVSVRKHGNLHKAIRDLAKFDATNSCNDGVKLCLVDPELTAAEVRDDLRSWGFHDWWLYSGDATFDTELDNKRNASDREATRLGQETTNDAVESQAPVIALSEIDDDLLSHWTRPVQHSWPDRNALSQWDVVWFGETAPEGAAGTLLRILAQQTILGSGRLIRGGQPMCCFTEVPLRDFADKRVFRSHLSRWDFEPYGISIRRTDLESIGGRPVRYITSEENDPADRTEKSWQVTGDTAASWMQEREWRVEGNVDLRVLPPDSVFVFVPDMETAETVRPFSRWPIVVIGTADSASGIQPQ